MKYMLIAGEASGDLHASRLINAISRRQPDAQFTIIGGDLMAAEAGVAPVIHYRDMAYMGFSEVLRHLGPIFRNLRTAKESLRAEKPDALILADYPSFNLKVAKEAKKLNIPVYYFISPKIWAWKKWRIKSIRRLVRKMLCILPFEPQWYRENGYDGAVYVGNPSLEEMDHAIAEAPSRETFLKTNRLRDHRIIALLPGSRRGEIRCNLPVMDAVARQFPQYTIVVGGAPGIPDDFYQGLTKFTVIRDQTHSLLAHAHAALVTSGTASLEAALAGVPQVAMYRSNGSKVAYNMMKRILSVDFVTLPNLISGKAIIPEMLLHFCTTEGVAAELRALTPDNSEARARQLAGYNFMRAKLGTEDCADNAADVIINDISQ
ncbi:MAG: lipid-A-disaccharide synthase [Muribaculaceae bacterium]